MVCCFDDVASAIMIVGMHRCGCWDDLIFREVCVCVLFNVYVLVCFVCAVCVHLVCSVCSCVAPSTCSAHSCVCACVRACVCVRVRACLHSAFPAQLRYVLCMCC